jgi:glutamyl endopeptidase
MEIFSVSNFDEAPAPLAAGTGMEAGQVPLTGDALGIAPGAPGGVPATGARLAPPIPASPGTSAVHITTGQSGPLAGPRRKNPVTGLETIIGDDQRVAITDSKNDPWRRICQLDLVGSQGVFKGTGWFAGPGTVITAGHCVHYAVFFGGWAETITVTPGRHQNEFPYGQSRSTRFSTLNLWIDGQSADFDIGCIHLDEPIGAATGCFEVQVLEDPALDGRMVNVSGYPTDKDLAKVQYHHANRVMQVTDRRIFYEIDTVSGQSGAPVWCQDGPADEPACVAIHAYGVPGTPVDLHITANSAPRIDRTIAALLSQWVAADNRRLGL